MGIPRAGRLGFDSDGENDFDFKGCKPGDIK
jgi:hypothetical protein